MARHARRLRKVGALIPRPAEEIAMLGKPLSAARADIAGSAELLDYAWTLPEKTERLDVGIIWTNSRHHLNRNTRYEGHKMSGLGEDLGLVGIATFTRLKVN